MSRCSESLPRGKSVRTGCGLSFRRFRDWDRVRHPLLGVRLRECAGLVYAVEGRSVSEIFGYPDDLKFHSSATLFAGAAKRKPEADSDDRSFEGLLTKYFNGEPDRGTLDRL
jgi:uncharacterized protein (DUF1810 family)